MGTFLKHLLPKPQAYYESQGLVFQPGGKQWRTARCQFHGGSDTMRIHLPSGAFVCMACCGARGGDVLTYHMAAHNLGYVEAAQALGAWSEAPAAVFAKHLRKPRNPSPGQPTARTIMSLVESEMTLCAMMMLDAARGRLSMEDAQRFTEAAGRIQFVAHFAGIEIDGQQEEDEEGLYD